MKPRTLVRGGAALLVLAGLLLARRSTVPDGDPVFEMARQLGTRHALGVPNGLEVVDSVELLLVDTVRRGALQEPVAAPFLALVAAPAYLLGGVRGLSALEALALGALVLGFFAVARRLFDERVAAVAALAMPLCTPVFSYALFELPHLVGAACLMWAVHFLAAALDEEAPRRALVRGALAGLLAGFAVGVRLPLLLPALVLLVAAATEARRRWPAAVGLAAPLATGLAALALINERRFGLLDPLAFGDGLMVPATSYYLTDPGVLHLAFLLVLACWACRRWATPHRLVVRGAAGALAAALLVSSTTLRAQLARLADAARLLLVDASLGWLTPRAPFGFVSKSLLQASPLLILGLVGAVWLVARPRAAPPLLRWIGWMCLVTLGQLALRLPSSGDVTLVLGGAVLTPRYLTEIAPLLFLLACYLVREVRYGPRALWCGVVVGGYLAWLFVARGPTDADRTKQLVLLYGSLLLATALAAAWLLRRRTGAAVLLACLVASAGAYGAAVSLAEDGRIIVQLKRQTERGVEELERVLPQRLVLVGWGGAVEPAFALRATREVVFVNTAWDDGASLVTTLKAFQARGLPIYYFGLGMERAWWRLAGSYQMTQLDPRLLLWRLEPVGR